MTRDLVICASSRRSENPPGELNKAYGIARLIQHFARDIAPTIWEAKLRVRTRGLNYLYPYCQQSWLMSLYQYVCIVDPECAFKRAYKHPIIISFNKRGEVPAAILKKKYGGHHIHIGYPCFMPAALIDKIFLCPPFTDKIHLQSYILPFFPTNQYADYVIAGYPDPLPGRVALLLGGNDASGDFTWSLDESIALVKRICVLCRQAKRQVSIITSRRTGQAVEYGIENLLAEYQDVVYDYIAYQQQPTYDIGPLLRAAEFCFVTADSETMVSDAVALQRHCVVLLPACHDSGFIYLAISEFVKKKSVHIQPWSVLNSDIWHADFEFIENRFPWIDFFSF